jgi:hypothetical protein
MSTEDESLSELSPAERKRRARQERNEEVKLDSLLRSLKRAGYELSMPAWRADRVRAAGFTGKNLALATVAADILSSEHPITLRGLFYRVVSAGWLPSTEIKHYKRLGKVAVRLRESRSVPFNWIVDNVRATLKPPSWSGLSEYAEICSESYRLAFWDSLPDYVHVFCEKDAIAGVIQPVTEEFDVRLTPIRGYASLSLAHEVASLWNRIEKPIHAFYLGDFDPAGFDIERDLKDKLWRYGEKEFSWTRLGVNSEDFEAFDLLPLKIKKGDRRGRSFAAIHGPDCAEVDALPASEIRRRVQEGIETFIPITQWYALQEQQEREREGVKLMFQSLAA